MGNGHPGDAARTIGDSVRVTGHQGRPDGVTWTGTWVTDRQHGGTESDAWVTGPAASVTGNRRMGDWTGGIGDRNRRGVNRGTAHSFDQSRLRY
jgi:hypothetical protein